MENVNIEESHSQAQDQYTLKGVALMTLLKIQISHYKRPAFSVGVGSDLAIS